MVRLGSPLFPLMPVMAGVPVLLKLLEAFSMPPELIASAVERNTLKLRSLDSLVNRAVAL